MRAVAIHRQDASVSSFALFTEWENRSLAEIQLVEPVVRFCGMISRHPESVEWAIEKISEHWGKPVLQSPPISFEAGGYYRATMGDGLLKTLVAFEGFCDPGELAGWKVATNHWEKEYAANCSHPETRPLNLDPGYTSQAKLVLATTKDRDHRIYLRDGIFAEVTLTYVRKTWEHHRWSYPTYRGNEVASFAQQCREHLRAHLKQIKQFRQREQGPVPTRERIQAEKDRRETGSQTNNE